jgi:hypothetical protein
LQANGLISEEEGEDVRPEAGFAQLSVFEVSWLRCEVTPDRLAVSTGEAPLYERVRDVVTGTLDRLRHTPVSALGLNHTYHVALPDRDAWHRVGDLFAPKEPWEDLLTLPGMRDVTVSSVRPDLYSGNINVTLQPSATVHWGFFLAHNDHYNLKTVESQPTSREEFERASILEDVKAPEPSSDLIPIAQSILNDNWASSLARAESLLAMIWDKAVKT